MCTCSCTSNTMKHSELCFNFLCQLSELVRSHIRWVSGNLITTGLHRNWQIFLKFWWFLHYSTKQQRLLCKKSTYLCLTLCDFVISSDFANSFRRPVPRAVYLDQYYALTDFWLFAQIKEADIKNCTISGLDTWRSDPSAGPLYSKILMCTMAVALNNHA